MPAEFLPVEQILEMLRETPLRLAALAEGQSPAQLQAASQPGEWSAAEVLAHLRACSDVWGDVYIRSILAHDQPVIKAVNPRRWIQSTNYLDEDFHTALERFTAQRQQLLAVLEPLPPAGWQRTAKLTGAGKPLRQTLISHADGLARHERAHLKQIERTLKALRR